MNGDRNSRFTIGPLFSQTVKGWIAIDLEGVKEFHQIRIHGIEHIYNDYVDRAGFLKVNS